MRNLRDSLAILLHQFLRLPKPDLMVLIRHGQSATNKLYEQGKAMTAEAAQSSVLDVPDHKVPLTELGHHQALAISPKVKELYGLFDVIYHSDYLRTIQTRDGALSAYTPQEIAKMKMRRNPKLGERQRGYLYDLSEEEIDEIYPRFKAYSEKHGYFWARPPGGEAQYDAAIRTYDIVGEIFRHRPKQKVCIFAHGGTIRNILYNVLNWTPDEYEKDAEKGPCENASVTELRRNPKTNRLELHSYNQVYY